MFAPAIISTVARQSPFDDAGFTPGCAITAVNGQPLRDIIDWRWQAAGDTLEVSYIDCDGDTGEIELVREEGEDWGIDFTEALFDGTIQCKNACSFCFMRQLPKDARDTLTLRDDDYRLSFLQGTFVTFTNLDRAEIERILALHLSPLRFSLHAVTPSLRLSMIGKHAQHGLDVAEELLAGGIELHAQIVLVPGQNDGDELVRTLEWAYDRPGILNVGIVPVGYTKHQTAFSESFEDVERARFVVDAIAPFQQRALEQRGTAWVFASDEFYRNAYPDSLLEHLPPAQTYGDYELFEDGIGIVRSFVDDFRSCADVHDATRRTLAATQQKALFVSGCAQREYLTALFDEAGLTDYVVPLYVDNDYFGGNVDVTGLLCGCDIAPAIAQARQNDPSFSFAVIPSVVFNADQVTLDQMTVEQIADRSACPVRVVSCQASEYVLQIAQIAQELEAKHHV